GRVEAGEGGAERLTLAEDGEPGEAGLEALQADLLEEAGVVGDRPAPLGVVVLPVQGVGGGPGAASLRHAPEGNSGQLQVMGAQTRRRPATLVTVTVTEAPGATNSFRRARTSYRWFAIERSVPVMAWANSVSEVFPRYWVGFGPGV